MSAMNTPSRLKVDATKWQLLDARVSGIDAIEGDHTDSLMEPPTCRQPASTSALQEMLTAPSAASPSDGDLSGKKRPRRKPDHPTRVLDHSDSKNAYPDIFDVIADDSRQSRGSTSRHAGDGDDSARKRQRNSFDGRSTPVCEKSGVSPHTGGSGQRGNAKSPQMLAAAAQAAKNAALASGFIAQTIGFDNPAAAPIVSQQLNAQFAAAQDSTISSSTGGGAKGAHAGKSPATQPAPQLPVAPSGLADRGKAAPPITAFFQPTQPRNPVHTGSSADINQDSMEGELSTTTSKSLKGAASFPGATMITKPSTHDSINSNAAHQDLSSEAAKLRSQLEQAQLALKQVTAALSKSTSEAESLREKITGLRTELDASKEAVAKVNTDFEVERKSAATNLVGILRDAAVKEAAAVRRRVAENQGRLGRFALHRSGHTVFETWEDGDEYLALVSQESTLKIKKAELDKIKKDITRRHKKLRGTESKSKKGKAGEDSDDSDVEVGDPSFDNRTNTLMFDLHAANAALSKMSSASSLSLDLPASGVGSTEVLAESELAAIEEGIVSALASLKREESALADKRKALDAEKAVFMLDLKRLRAETASKWRNNPVLGSPPRYMLLEVLGKGGFSEVWRGIDLYEIKEVAVKIHQLAAQWSEEKKRNYVRHAMREYEIQKALEHAYVVRLHDVIEINADCFATVLEYCKGSDLEKVLKSQTVLPEREARSIILQVMSALRYLNGYSSPWSAGETASTAAKRKIIHYDLKPANILFDEFRNAKITDFGLSKIIEDDALGSGTSMELTSQGAGTYWYLPPECFRADVRISSKVDVWSVGVIFYQMLYGKRPFGDSQTQEQLIADPSFLQEASRGPAFPAKPAVSKEAKAFISRCLTAEVSSRPDVMSISEDPYLRK